MNNPRSRLNSMNITSPLIGSRIVAGSPSHYNAPSATYNNYAYSSTPHVAPVSPTYPMHASTYNPGLAYNLAPTGQSRVEYVPYEKTRIEYEPKEYVEQVPVERTVIDYQPVKKIDYVPRERTVIDYYPVEHQISYVPQTIPEKHIDYVPVQTTQQRVEYIPYERQVVHYPDEMLKGTTSSTYSKPRVNGYTATSEAALRRSRLAASPTRTGAMYNSSSDYKYSGPRYQATAATNYKDIGSSTYL